MTQTFVIYIAREAIFAVLILAGPAMFAALLIGLVISVLQATTQIQDQMLNMVPKIIGVFLVLLITGAWMLNFSISFISNVFNEIPNLLH